MLQKSRMPQIQDGKGEAVVIYAESLTTPEMRYPRLSRRVNNSANMIAFLEFTVCAFVRGGRKIRETLYHFAFVTFLPSCLWNGRVKTRDDSICVENNQHDIKYDITYESIVKQNLTYGFDIIKNKSSNSKALSYLQCLPCLPRSSGRWYWGR